MITLRKLKRIIHGHRTLAQTIQWQELYRYALQDVGLEIIEFGETEPPQTVLVLAPHPDDEIFGCGGTIARHLAHGDTVHVIYLTDGSRGTPSGRRDRSLIELREQEARAGLQILGDAKLLFWRFPDSELDINKTTIGLLKGQLETIQPDVVYLPWYGDDHPDHYVSVPLMVEVLSIMKNDVAIEVRQYEVWTPLIPNRLVAIGDVVEQKIHAMEAHQSQLQSRMYRDGVLGLNTYRGAFGGLEEPAEAFFALPKERFLHFYQKIIGA